MTFHELIARVVGIDPGETIEQLRPSLAAPWAQGRLATVTLACVAIAAATSFIYLRLQTHRSRGVRLLLATSRSALCCLLLLMLAEPTLVMRVVRHPQPLVWLLFDGTESMAIRDAVASDERQRWASSVGSITEPTTSDEPPSRMDLVRQVLGSSKLALLDRLQAKFRVKAFLFNRPDAVHALANHDASESTLRADELADQLSADGTTTALGAALADLATRHANSHLGALIVFSDFDQNSGPSPLVTAEALGVPVYTVGVGPSASVDVAIELDAPPVMKKSEGSTIQAFVRQQGLAGRTIGVTLAMQRDSGELNPPTPTVIGRQEVTLDGPSATLRFGFTPTETGRVVLIATVDAIADEVVCQNNVAQRESVVRDDFLRLMYVEHDPTWEWRFIKEVFHRDPLVGARGFRTFLRSADPKVRQTNEFFLSSLTPPRSEFFANDVVVVGDMPEQMLTARFCERVKEFVGMFGGGLVVVTGPNVGPAALARTALADVLPVVVDPNGRLRDAREFAPQLTASAAQYDFMQLGPTAGENRRAWANIAPLPWYQPVERVRDGASVLLAHPTDYCSDGTTLQPIIAIRPYGKGQVVYVAMNETWRLRRKYGERYYRRFWGQMIYRLGLGHALGSQKRFVVRADRDSYQNGDEALLTVEAYDENYEPLSETMLDDHVLTGKLLLPRRDEVLGIAPALGAPERPLTFSVMRPGVFATRISALVPGEYHARVTDPITKSDAEVVFSVSNTSPERRSVTRNVALQQQLAAATGGEASDLVSVVDLPDRINPTPRPESSIEVIAVWNTWVAFIAVVGLMLFEWFVRKMVHLP